MIFKSGVKVFNLLIKFNYISTKIKYKYAFFIIILYLLKSKLSERINKYTMYCPKNDKIKQIIS